MRIEVQRDESPLRRQRWTFWVVTDWAQSDRVAAVLDIYESEVRESTRKRRWTVERGYYRHSYRAQSARIVADPPIPDDVRAEVIERITAGVVFVGAK